MATSLAPNTTAETKIKSINGETVVAVHESKYGTTYVHGARTYRDSSLASFQQDYTYVSYSEGNVTKESTWAASTQDYSRATKSEDYDAKCACCWYGFGHTIEKHNQSVLGN